MAILTGRYGTVKWNALGVVSPPNLQTIISLNGWKISLKTPKEDVTCFQDANKMYVPGIPDVSGSLTGFFNAAELHLVAASQSGTPGYLQLGNNSTSNPTTLFGGLAYLDVDIDCTLAAPKIAGTFVAGGTWTLPS
jgi:hypothetical protein